MCDDTNTARGVDSPDADPPLDRDAAFELLAVGRRRRVLWLLLERSGPTPLERLARDVATREAAGDEAPARLVRRVRISLHHWHLPKLDSGGVAEYDADGRTVRYLGDARVEAYLRAGSEGRE